MANPRLESWGLTDTNVTSANLDFTTFGGGTTSLRNGISSWPNTRPFFDTDLAQWFYNSHASAPSSVTWTSLVQEASKLFAYPFTYPTAIEGEIKKFPSQNISWMNSDGVANPMLWGRMGGGYGIFADDFTSYTSDANFDASYVQITGADVNPSAANDRIDFNLTGTTALHGVYKDLGAGNVSDSLWTLRFRLHLTTWTSNTNAQAMDLNIVLAEVNSARDITQDFICLGLRNSTSTEAFRAGDGLNIAVAGQTDFAITPTSGTDYYCELTRQSTTGYEARIFSDNTYESLTEAETGLSVSASVTGARYLKILTLDNTAADGVILGYIDDFQFFNNDDLDNTV